MWSSADAARSLAWAVRASSPSNSRRTASTLTVTPGVLEGEQADPEGPLDERRPVVGRPLGDEPGETRVGQHEVLDDDPVAVETDLARLRRGQRPCPTRRTG